MIKYLLALGILSCIFSSCVHNGLYDSDSVKQKIENCTLTETLNVPIKDGYATIVTCREDTLAVANRPISIIIPKQSQVSTKSATDDDIKIDYGILESTITYSKYWQAVMFEDTEYGDYDYNDLIIHVRNTCNYPWNKNYSEQTIEIQPIALGSQKIIKLGCLLGPELTEVIIAEDVRKELFNGATGFINTVNEQEPIRYKLSPTSVTNYRIGTVKLVPTIAWFIEINGKRYYAISSDIDFKSYNMFNREGMPYGLVSTYDRGIFGYPQEKTTIFEVYPDFKDWYDGKKATFEKNRVSELVYKYCYGNIIGPNGEKNKIWDWDY